MKGIILALLTFAIANLTALPLFAVEKSSADASYQQYLIIDINKATHEQLLELKGIGETKAQAIIDYREEHGKFTEVEELLRVKGVGYKIIQQNQHLLKV